MPLNVFAGGRVGAWQVERIEPVTGPSLPVVSRLAVLDGSRAGDVEAAWVLLFQHVGFLMKTGMVQEAKN